MGMTSDRITFGRTVRTFDAGGAVLTETVHAARSELARHEHANPNVNFVLHGTFGERVERRDCLCETGSVLLKPGGASHSNRYGEHRVHCLIAEFSPAPGSPMEDELRRMDDLWYTEDTAVAALGWRLYREVREPDGATPLSIAEALAELLGVIGASRGQERLAAGQPAWLRRVRERLDEAADVELESLVAEAGVHPHHLPRAFRRHVGCSMGEYTRRRRIRRAQTLLAQPAMSVAAIALEVGFCDQSHFTRVFKRVTRTTPAAYRRLVAGFNSDDPEMGMSV